MRRLIRWALLLIVLVGSGAVPGCGRGRISAQRASADLATAVQVRDVRVQLAGAAARVRVRVVGPFVVRSARGQTVLSGHALDWTTVRAEAGSGVVFGDRVLGLGVFDLSGMSPGAPVEVAVGTGTSWEGVHRYAGVIRFAAAGGDALQLINVVDLETYVACVLPGELFPHFEREAFRGQAIAVRTYALYQMADRGGQAFDLSATHFSQVYHGLAGGSVQDRAREAAAYTRGIIATWSSPAGERIFCTYYSSCCGGWTQSVTNCRPDLPMIPPLAGGVRCDCLSVARGPKYRWPPLRISKGDLTSKLAARYGGVRSLGRIEGIEVVRQTEVGRPVTLRLVGATGARFELPSEHFRLAVGSGTLRSTFCRISTGREEVVFADGRGFGHGMGMCQWGAQAMALRGYGAGQILRHYYPGCNLTRVY